MKENVENRDSRQAELFTASQVARFCHVDLKTIHNWAEKGQIRHFRTPGRHLRFRRPDVLEFLRRFGYPVPDALRPSKPTVIAVDEDAAALSAIRRALGRRFEVSAFQDPLDALVAIGTLAPDAIVIDIQMKGVDGLRCLERLRSNEATAQVRAVVFSAQLDKRRAALDAGAHDFVPKGDPGLLRESLERLTGVDRV